MIYRNKDHKRTILGRYGVVTITHGQYAGRLGYYDDDEHQEKKAIVYLYNSDYSIDRKHRYLLLNYSWIVRVEINERGYQDLDVPLDVQSFGWDRYYSICEICQKDVGDAYLLEEDTRGTEDDSRFWVCSECKALNDKEFWKLKRKQEMTIAP